MATRLVRDWFTNEIKEIEFTPNENGKTILYKEEVHYEPKRHGAAFNKPWRSTALSVHPDQAAAFNEAASAAGTHARYDMETGDLMCNSKSSRKLEAARRGFYDADEGY
jgi:hypothetical protein